MMENSVSKMAVCKQASCCLLLLSVGLIFCVLLGWLAYFTYQSVTGNVPYCSAWTDIPGRLAILSTSYYIASMCGCFPLPRRCLPSWFRAPFTFWRFQSWYDLINSCLPYPSVEAVHRLRRNAMYARDSPELPLFREEQERFYDCMPAMRRRSAPVRVAYPPSYVRPDSASASPDANAAGNSEVSESSNSSRESFMSFDSPLGGHIVPMVKGRSKKPPYLPDSVKPKRKSPKHLAQTMYGDCAVAHASDKSDDSDASQYSEMKAPNYPVVYSRGLLTSSEMEGSEIMKDSRGGSSSDVCSADLYVNYAELNQAEETDYGSWIVRSVDSYVNYLELNRSEESRKRSILGRNFKTETEARAANSILTNEDTESTFKTNPSEPTDKDSPPIKKTKPDTATGESSGTTVCVDAGRAELEPLAIEIPKSQSEERRKRPILGKNFKTETEARAANSILTNEDTYSTSTTNPSGPTDKDSPPTKKTKPDTATGESSGTTVCVDAGRAEVQPLAIEIPKPQSPTEKFLRRFPSAGTFPLADRQKKLLLSKKFHPRSRGAHLMCRSTPGIMNLGNFRNRGDSGLSHSKSPSASSTSSMPEFAQMVMDITDTRGIPSLPILQSKVDLLKKKIQAHEKRYLLAGARELKQSTGTVKAALGHQAAGADVSVASSVPREKAEEQNEEGVPRSSTAAPKKEDLDSGKDT